MECEFCRKMIFCLLHGDRYIDVINTEGYPLYYCVKCLIKNFKDKTPAPYITAVVHDHLDMVILMKAAKKEYTYEILKQEFPKLFEPIKSISEEEFERQQELLHKHR